MYTVDYVAVRQLLFRYRHLLDEADLAGLVALFSPDACVTPEYEGQASYTGRSAIGEWYERYLAASLRGSSHRRHAMASPAIDVHDGAGECFAHLQASGLQHGDSRLWIYVAWYRDELVRTHDRWFLRSRRIGINYSYPANAVEICRKDDMNSCNQRTCGGAFPSTIKASCGLEPGGYPVPTPEVAMDIVAIEQILNRYCYLHDFGTCEEIASLFAPDAVVYADYLGDRTFEGRQAICDWYAQSLETYKANGHFERRRISCPVINVRDDSAESIAFVDFDALNFESNIVNKHVGRYEHTFEKAAGRWFIKTLRIQLQYSHPCNSHRLARNGMLEMQAIGRLSK